MKIIKIFGKSFTFLIMTLVISIPAAWAVENYSISHEEFLKNKNFYDDPRPYLINLSYKKILPPDIYNKLKFDVKAMQDAWAEVVGFRAPDVVGKIAPEIKPGKYSYKDKEKYPGLKELMIPHNYQMFKPGEPPFAGNFPEMEVIPTKQYYYALPIAEATKKYKGETKLDQDGLLISETYKGGYPFPRPEGKFMGNQIIYNHLKKYIGGETNYNMGVGRGWSKHREDRVLLASGVYMRVCGRVLTEPYGWYDERAKKQDESDLINAPYLSPRDMYGNVVIQTNYNDPKKYDRLQMYINSLRRVRTMSATDIQDAAGGADGAFCDAPFGFGQKPTRDFWPFTTTLVTEREYLVPAYLIDGSEYISSKGVERRNFRFQRRPTYVVKVAYKDKNFIYGYRNLYIDKETFFLYLAEQYDQKGRLYRTFETSIGFEPEMGHLGTGMIWGMIDHIDLHNTYTQAYFIPALWLNRTDFGFEGIGKKGK